MARRKTDPKLAFLAANFDKMVALGRKENGARWEAAVDASGMADSYRAAADRGDAQRAAEQEGRQS